MKKYVTPELTFVLMNEEAVRTSNGFMTANDGGGEFDYFDEQD